MSEPRGPEDTDGTRPPPVLEKENEREKENKGEREDERERQETPVGGPGRLGHTGRPDSAAGQEPPPGPDDGGRQRRFWSARRVPAGALALLLLAGTGLLLYDVVAVRAGRPAMWWRRSLARELAERPLDDIWVLTGAGIAVALGLWLLLLALTPGLRDVLPMRRVHPDVRAGLHRDAAALNLRDRAMEVPGVRSVRVRVRRRKVDVRAVAHFREPDEVRADLGTVLTDGVGRLGLSRPPAPAVRVRRPGRRNAEG
ncbi:hypothetical protein GCM10010145_57640 [Streptomyces ruber]|uniref:DUF6286 domain-containing protein n=2 Tax=Streptomyces TaxID=1883 RepID=A0A918BPH2_9ACTN|nr:DUF6286 domain-containing protein [Streptomyces ruber]GGQ80422.1 hypothetical protein GCM10010145_57640 [Streptomyces ruber]